MTGKISEISKKEINNSDYVAISSIRLEIVNLIKKNYPDISLTGYISKEELNQFRTEYLEILLKKEKGELNKLDKDVLKSMVAHESLVKNLDKEKKSGKLTFGQKLADKVAEFGGSWTFIILFGFFLLIWVLINVFFILSPFDPYPFILLNLFLSCLAAIQAPIIMMSQNRKEQRDRQRAENDYKINLKSELEIRQLHEKIDHLTQHQWQRLLEIQKLELDLLEEKIKKK